MLDVDGALLHARPAGGAGPDDVGVDHGTAAGDGGVTLGLAHERTLRLQHRRGGYAVQPLREPVVDRGLRQERHARLARPPAQRPEHRAHQQRLRRRNPLPDGKRNRRVLPLDPRPVRRCPCAPPATISASSVMRSDRFGASESIARMM